MQPKRILVRGPNWIGDHILASDFFAGLRAAYPSSHIALACPSEIAPLARMDWFDEVRQLTPAQRRVVSGWKRWRGLGAEGWDLGVTLTASASAAILLRATGAPRRVGYGEPLARLFLTDAWPWLGRESGRHKSQLYRDLLALVAGQAAGKLPSEKPHRAEGPIVLAPGASIRLREWPGFVELARALREKYPDTTIRVVGTAAQAPWEERFAALGDPAVESWIGLTNLTELVELCREARFVVANDSGVAHLAATLAGARTVVVFGPGDPAYVLPMGPSVKIARATGVPCSPCEKPRCHARHGYQTCLKSLDVPAVLRQIASLD